MPGEISPRLFRFFSELARHNDRQWFEDNKARYVEDVRDPLLRFIEAVGPRLAKISRHIVADPRPVGGSLFRIRRDTRFSRDKTPCKTHAGLHFRHAAGRDVHAPTFYLHLQPGMVFAAGGMWRPPAEAVKQVRDAIVARPDAWRRAIRACPLSHEDDRLERAPRGYDPEHPLVEDLKRQTFITSTRFTQADACAPDFVDLGRDPRRTFAFGHAAHRCPGTRSPPRSRAPGSPSCWRAPSIRAGSRSRCAIVPRSTRGSRRSTPSRAPRGQTHAIDIAWPRSERWQHDGDRTPD